jgi:hypothetical protein
MSLKIRDGNPPFVIDRGPAAVSIFRRAPGARELVADDDGEALAFPTEEVAESWLLQMVGLEGLEAYAWTILPADEVGW